MFDYGSINDQFYSVLNEFHSLFSDNGEEVTPVPIPNTVVKLFSADGSRL